MNYRSAKIRLISLVIGFVVMLPPAVHAVTISSEAIKTAVSNHVEKNMPWAPGTVRIEFLSKIVDAVFDKDPITIELQNRPEETFIGDTLFSIKYISNGVKIKEDVVRVRLEVLTDVVISSRALTRDCEIKAEDIRIIKKWLRRTPVNLVGSDREVIGKAVNLNLPKNVEIQKNILKSPLLVKKGNMVQIAIDNGSLSVMTLGVSEEDGIADKMIRVRNISSNKIIYARVVDRSLVTVEF